MRRGLHVFTGQTQGVAEVDHQKYGQNTRRSIAQPGLCLLLGQFGAQAKQYQQVKRRKDQALVVAQGLGTGKQHHRHTKPAAQSTSQISPWVRSWPRQLLPKPPP